MELEGLEGRDGKERVDHVGSDHVDLVVGLRDAVGLVVVWSEGMEGTEEVDLGEHDEVEELVGASLQGFEGVGRVERVDLDHGSFQGMGKVGEACPEGTDCLGLEDVGAGLQAEREKAVQRELDDGESHSGRIRVVRVVVNRLEASSSLSSPPPRGACPMTRRASRRARSCRFLGGGP